MRKEIPYTFGLEWRTLCAGIAGGTARTLVECPFEYAKVKRQTGQQWHFNQLYKGFKVLYPRTVVMMMFFFSIIDLSRKNTNLMASLWG